MNDVRTNCHRRQLCLLVYFGNPAVALVIGMIISLALDRSPIADGSRYGKYLLQSAIVLLGFKLNSNQLLDISGTYTLPIAAYVCLDRLLWTGTRNANTQRKDQCTDFLWHGYLWRDDYRHTVADPRRPV